MSDPDSMTLISDLVTAEESISCGFYCDQLTAIKMLETKGNYCFWSILFSNHYQKL